MKHRGIRVGILCVLCVSVPLWFLPRLTAGARAVATAAETDLCPPLAPPGGSVVDVSSVAALQAAVDAAAPGVTIRIADGTYNLNGVYLRIAAADVTLRSASGNRDAVILDGNYVTTEIVQIAAPGVTIADLTLRRAYDHPIHVVTTPGSGADGTTIYNVHVVDPGQQAIKVNPGYDSPYYADNGVVACSHVEMTDAGRTHVRDGCYTGGVDVHQARGWVVRDNLVEGFWCANGLSEHAIHFWKASRDTVVERNVLRENARGVGFGMDAEGSARTYPDNPCPGGYVDHYDGVIRNNFVFASRGALFDSEYGFDCGLCLWQACGARVLHNTVASTAAPFSSIEWRFSRTSVELTNNLVTHNLMDRGGSATLAGNVDSASLSLFVDGPGGDLHLASAAAAAIDQGVALSYGCADDVDGDARPIGAARDVGADEYGVPPPAAVSDLRVTAAITGTGALTATLHWTPLAGAITTTLRYSGMHITAANWAGALTVVDPLTGTAGSYTATVPYGGGVAYFALTCRDASGDESPLSNNGFWPSLSVYLPILLR